MSHRIICGWCGTPLDGGPVPQYVYRDQVYDLEKNVYRDQVYDLEKIDPDDGCIVFTRCEDGSYVYVSLSNTSLRSEFEPIDKISHGICPSCDVRYLGA